MNTGHRANSDSAGDADEIVRWVERAQSGDRQAFQNLVDLFEPDIFRMLYYRTHSQMDAEDLTQDVFLRAFRNMTKLKSPAVFRAWLYRIAVNRVRDYYRRKKLRSVLGFESTDEETFENAEGAAIAPEATQELNREAFWTRVRDMMGLLSKLEREVFYLRFFDELSIKEITSALGKNESTVKTHLYRALTKIKAAAAQMDDLMESL